MVINSNLVEYCGLGKKKSSVARVRLRHGSGRIFVNKKDVDLYFPQVIFPKSVIHRSLEAIGKKEDFDVYVNVRGGGICSQLEASALGVSSCILKVSSDYKSILKQFVKDPRKKRRKLYGQYGFAAKYPFVKR